MLGQLDHDHWDEVAKRWLSCGNCTLACPTCFCWDVTIKRTVQHRDKRERIWDSCFNPSYSTRPVAIRGHDPFPLRQWSHTSSGAGGNIRHAGLRGLRPVHNVVPAGIDTRVEVETLQKESSNDNRASSGWDGCDFPHEP